MKINHLHSLFVILLNIKYVSNFIIGIRCQE